jgi:uncharacterized protein YuzE
MKRYLEITFTNGKPLAAYFSLNRRPGDHAARSEPRADGYIVDYSADGRVIGIEITAPSRFSVAGINALLAELSMPPISAAEAGPLAA